MELNYDYMYRSAAYEPLDSHAFNHHNKFSSEEYTAKYGLPPYQSYEAFGSANMSSTGSTGVESTDAQSSMQEDWRNIEDPSERRRVQNRMAQRKYRERKRNEQEEIARIAENQQVAGSSYISAEPEDLEHNDHPTGLPWGSYSIKHVIEAGKAKTALAQGQGSQEGSVSGRSPKTNSAHNGGGKG